LEGGDVLFTGKEFFVGISEFTNEAGARAVAAAFPEFPVCPIKVCKNISIFWKSNFN
jgi:dimethylargininase